MVHDVPLKNVSGQSYKVKIRTNLDHPSYTKFGNINWLL